MLRRIRVVIAIVFFCLITFLFLDFTGTAHECWSWLAKIQFIPSLLALNVVVLVGLVLLTLLLGRIYCSVICPLGVMQDLFAWLGKRFKKNRYSYSSEKKIVRYVILALFILLLVIPGTSVIANLIEPYSAYGRIANALLSPVYQWCNNILASFSEERGSYTFYQVDIWMKGVAVLVVAVLTLLAVGFLAWRNGRTWCNTVCPVGTILGFLSRFSLFKVMIDEQKCTSCGLCARNCKGSCIDHKEHKIDYSRCVVCLDCVEKCNKKAIGYEPRYKGKTVEKEKQEESSVDTSRRQFLTVGAMMVAGATIEAQAKKVDGGLTVLQDKKIPERRIPIKPAGALSIKHFSQHCTACQLCVSACPNDVLRPSSDLTRFMQPEMSYEKGYCRPECNKCSQVCPTGAIQPIQLEDKSSTQIGHAVWIRENCLVETKGVKCGSCATHCPVAAIQMVQKDPDDPNSLKIPVVNESRCIGCGACENLCPSRPYSAIYVEGYEIHREN